MKKYDSVKQIIDTCSTLMEEGMNSECVDVKSLTHTLTEECETLEKMFKESPDKVRELNIQKNIVENTAIRLEFFLRVRHNSFVERNKMREFAEKLYTDTRQATLEFAKRENVSPIELNEWGTRTKWALEFYARSKHILFEVENEDEVQIRGITIALERLGNK